MFGLYRRCCSNKDNISVNDRDNVSNLNTFTNSSNISTISSSILYNRTYRSETGKIMNVLLLLFLVFGSCVVSFGRKIENFIAVIPPSNVHLNNVHLNNVHLNNVHLNNNNNNNIDNIIKKNFNKCLHKLSSDTKIFLSFANGLITGIGGYNNTWKPLKENWGLYWYRSNPWLAYGLNKRIYDSNYIDVDLHILGINFLAFLESIIILSIHITINKEMLSSETFLNQAQKTWQEKIVIIITNFCTLLGIGMYQFLDVEIKVFKYWSISLNLCVPYSLFTGRLKLYQLNI